MKRLGILTFWNVPNYGAFMQAYALQKVLENRYTDYDVKQIPYINQRHYDEYYSIFKISGFNYWLINPSFYKNIFRKIYRKNDIFSLKKFLDYYKVIPNFKHSINEKLSLDTLVLGSDIIWDYSVPFFGNDEYFFGRGINASKKISYAPSFGSVKDGSDAPDYVVRGLRELDAISVRDLNSAEIVKTIINKKVPIVLDPTLLWDFSADKNIVKPQIERYIVVYGSFFPDELINEAKEYAEIHKLKLICLSSLDDDFDWCDEVVFQDEMNPFEWVGYFQQADAVMTCTYHGLIFSLIFEKKIIFYMTDFILKKSKLLIENLGLSDVLIHYKHFNEKIDWNWNYSVINDKLDNMKKNSLDFLDGAIYDK